MDIWDVLGIATIGFVKRPEAESNSISEQEKFRLGELEPTQEKFRPQTFEQYIGQQRAKEKVTMSLELIIKGLQEKPNWLMQNQKEYFNHFIIAGKAGTGKTTLAYIIGNLLNFKVHTYIGGSFTREDLGEFLKNNLDDKYHVLFIDEIHALKKDIAEFMYPIIEDFVIGEDRKKIKPFILIGATTELYQLEKTVKPFLDRCGGTPIILENYTPEDIEKMLRQYNDKSFKKNVPDEVYKTLSQNTRYVPRISIARFKEYISCDNIDKVLRANRVIKNGLTDRDIKVLELLNETKNKKGDNVPVGMETLAIISGTDKMEYKETIEPFLLSEGYAIRTSRGRLISEKGRKLLAELKGA